MKLRYLVLLIGIVCVVGIAVQSLHELPKEPETQPRQPPQPHVPRVDDGNTPQRLLAEAYSGKQENNYEWTLSLLKKLQRKYPDFQSGTVSQMIDEVTLAKAERDKKDEEDHKKWVEEEEARAKTLAAQHQQEQERIAREKEELPAQMEAVVTEMLSKGAVYSVDTGLRQVRIDPLLWISCSLETKQQTVRFFSTYFAVKNKDNLAYATILSSRNDKVLGKMSVWSGVQVLE